MNLKHKSGNLKCQKREQERKKIGPNGWFSKSIGISKTKEPHGVGLGTHVLALYLVVWPAMCLFKISFIEVDASLKWMPWQSRLKSSTCITKIKYNCQGLYYNPPCDAKASESIVRTLTAWVTDMLKVRSRMHCNQENIHLNKIIGMSLIIIIQPII